MHLCINSCSLARDILSSLLSTLTSSRWAGHSHPCSHGRLCWTPFGFTMMYDILACVRAEGRDPYFAADHDHRGS
eukprot:4713338-Ditylum_brightwellii.AAC.1